jgi:hypothetical protein
VNEQIRHPLFKYSIWIRLLTTKQKTIKGLQSSINEQEQKAISVSSFTSPGIKAFIAFLLFLLVLFLALGFPLFVKKW